MEHKHPLNKIVLIKIFDFSQMNTQKDVIFEQACTYISAVFTGLHQGEWLLHHVNKPDVSKQNNSARSFSAALRKNLNHKKIHNARAKIIIKFITSTRIWQEYPKINFQIWKVFGLNDSWVFAKTFTVNI